MQSDIAGVRCPLTGALAIRTKISTYLRYSERYSRQPLNCSPEACTRACLRSDAAGIYNTVYAGAPSCRQVKCLPAVCTSNPALQSGLKLARPWAHFLASEPAEWAASGRAAEREPTAHYASRPNRLVPWLVGSRSRLVRPSYGPTSIPSFAPATAYGWSRHAFPRLADLAVS